MRRVLFIGVLLSFLNPLFAQDELEELKTELQKPWTRLRLSLVMHSGCTNEVFHGVEIHISENNLTVAAWHEKNEVDSLSEPLPLEGWTVDTLRDALITHYKAAINSISYHERLAALPNDEERKKERERVFAQMRAAEGIPIGGMGYLGIHIRIFRDEWVGRYQNRFGATGLDEFERWLFEELHPGHDVK